MLSDDTEITSIPIKKNVAFETVKGIFASYGVMIAALTVSASLAERLNKINPPAFTHIRYDNGKGRIDNATNFLRNITVMLAPIALFCGFVSNDFAKKHNKKVDELIPQKIGTTKEEADIHDDKGFTQRIEQEKLTPSKISAGLSS